MTTSSSDVADEEQFFFTQVDKNDEKEEQTLQRKQQSKQNAKQWVANEEPPSLKTSVKDFTKVDGNTIRRIPRMESKQMHKYEWSKMSLLC